MRPIQTIFAAVSALSVLSACSRGATPENESASGAINDQESVEVNATGPASPPPQETNTGGAGEPPTRSEASQPQPKAGATTPARPDRTPPPMAPRPRPAADPHAGHDMGNMANMSHD